MAQGRGVVFHPEFPEQKTLAEEYKNEEGFSEYELAGFKILMEKYVKNCGIRN